jgi:hypothetical protein
MGGEWRATPVGAGATRHDYVASTTPRQDIARSAPRTIMLLNVKVLWLRRAPAPEDTAGEASVEPAV